MYLLGFSMPNVCHSMNMQAVEVTKISHSFLRGFKLAEYRFDIRKIYWLIGVSLYWNIIDGGVKKVLHH